MKIALMDIKRQHEEHAEEYEAAALEVMRSGSYINGTNVKEFEKEFAAYVGVKYAIGVGNGTDALHIALQAAGIKSGDEVITTPFSFVATAEPIAALGARPVFVDIDPDTYCIDANKIEAAVTSKTKAIIPVHFYGCCADMDAINEIAEKYGLVVIEDACQAAGAEYKGRKAGSLGTIGCFSFFPTKTLGCDGDGGMITTNDLRIAECCQAIRVHGSGVSGLRTYNTLNSDKPKLEEDDDIDMSCPKYFNFVIGQNSRLDELQAAILRKKLAYLDDFITRRQEHAKYYSEHIDRKEYGVPFEPDACKHAFYLYVLKHDNAKKVGELLKEAGIGTGVYYPVPIHLQKAFCELGYKKGDFPVTEYMSEHTFAIPVFPELTIEEQKYVIGVLEKNFIEKV